MKVLYDLTGIEASAGIRRVALSLLERLTQRPGIELQLRSGLAEYSAAIEAVKACAHLPVILPSGLEAVCDRIHCAAYVFGTANVESRRSLVQRGMRRIAGEVSLLAREIASRLASVRVAPGQVYHRLMGPMPRFPANNEPIPSVITLYDLIPLHFWGGGGRAVRDRQRLLDSIPPETVVLAISESTRRDFLEATRHSPDRTLVTYLGVDQELFHPVEQDARIGTASLDRGTYLLSVSTLEERKNIAVILRAFASLCASPSFDHLR